MAHIWSHMVMSGQTWYLEAALLELHDGGVVDAGALGEDQDRQLVRVLHVVPQPASGLRQI